MDPGAEQAEALVIAQPKYDYLGVRQYLAVEPRE
jgi:hypothetical protein